ncbi:MAG: NUDIX domain-containing protein [bacterium]
MTLSAGVVIVRRERGEWRYLFLRAYRNWDFPKGIVEPSEGPLQAAIREVREETGITDLDFRWGEVFKETAPYANNKVARFYIAETHTSRVTFSINPELGRPEHHEYRWLSHDEILSLSPERLVPIIEWAHSLIREDSPEHPA